MSEGEILAHVPRDLLGRMAFLEGCHHLGASWLGPDRPLHWPSASSVGFVFGVRSLVSDEVRAVAKALATLRALVGPLPRVDALVDDEDGVPAEALTTLGAAVRLVPQVGALVHDQDGAPAEALAAH